MTKKRTAKPLKALADFRPASENTNGHTELGTSLLESSMSRDGYTMPMLAAADGEMLAGSNRLETAASVFPDVEPIIIESDGTRPLIHVRTDIPSAKSARAKRIGAMDNRIAQVGFRPDAGTLKKLVDEGVINGGTWGNSDDLQALMRSLRASKGESPQAAELIHIADQLQAKWHVEPNDLFSIPSAHSKGEHRLLCADSTDPVNVSRLMAGEQFGVLFSDPPYGLSYHPVGGVWGTSPREKIANDYIEPAAFLTFLKRFLSAIQPHALPDAAYYICMGSLSYHVLVQAVLEQGIRYAGPIIWFKNSIGIGWMHYRAQHELILTAGNVPIEGYHADASLILYGGAGSTQRNTAGTRWHGPRNESTVWTIPRDAAATYEHLTQKPVALPQRALRNSAAAGDIVLDVFAGTGSTVAASELEGCLCRAVEIEPRFCAVILERLQLLGLSPKRIRPAKKGTKP